MRFTPTALTLVCVSLISACSSIGPYSYSDLSQPQTAISDIEQQTAVHDQTKISDNICRIETERRNYTTFWHAHTTYHSSATLIDGRYLITAAHNVSDYLLSHVKSVTVSCGETSISDQTKTVVLNRSDIEKNVAIPRYQSRWPNTGKKFEFDYAFVDLGKVLNDTSSFEVAYQGQAVAGKNVSIAGYPHRPEYLGLLSNNGKNLYQGSGAIEERTGNLMSYKIETFTGNNGGPVWYNYDGKHFLVAIHVAPNMGRIVDETLIADWQEWRQLRQR